MSLRVAFPDYRLPPDEQNKEIIKSLEHWIGSLPFAALLEQFGFEKQDVPFESYLESVHDFVNENFDYYERSRQFGKKLKEADPEWLRDNEAVLEQLSNRLHITDLNELAEKLSTNERWIIFDDAFLLNNRPLLSQYITKIGLPGDIELINYAKEHLPDTEWMVILGGASATNEIRTRLATELCQDHNLCVAGLSGERLSNEREKTIRNQKYESIQTEFDSMKLNMEIQFDLPISDVTYGEDFEARVHEYGADMSKWPQEVLNATSRYYSLGNYHVMSAPSNNPALRRANTLDTMDYFLKKCVTPPSNIMLISSSRYAAYTVFSFWKHYRVERDLTDINFFFTGNAGAMTDREMLSSYLLEVRNGVNAGYDLYHAMAIKEENLSD